MVNILITCVGGDLMPFTIKYLKNIRNIKLKIVGTDSNTNAIGKYFCDKFYKVPKGNSKLYITECEKIVNKEKINLIIPTSDEEAITLSKKIEYFRKKNITLACVDYKTLKIFNNKASTYKELKKLDIPTADWSEIKNEGFLVKKIKFYFEKYGGAVIKPKRDRGGRNIYIISKKRRKYSSSENINIYNNIQDFLPHLKAMKNFNNFLIMQELSDPVVDIDLLSWKGKSISVIPRKRIHPLFPNMGHETLNNKKLILFGQEIIKKFNLSWLYDCDVMFDNNSNPILIEINPRQSGSIAISIAAGFKIYEKIIQLYMDKKVNSEKKFKEKIIIPYKSLYNIPN